MDKYKKQDFPHEKEKVFFPDPFCFLQNQNRAHHRHS